MSDTSVSEPKHDGERIDMNKQQDEIKADNESVTKLKGNQARNHAKFNHFISDGFAS